MVRDARADAAASVSAALAVTTIALQSGAPEDALRALAPMKATLYDAAGRVVRASGAPPGGGLIPPDVACGPVTVGGSPGTLCIESASLNPRVRDALTLIVIATLAALIVGTIAGRALARSSTAPLRKMTDIVHKAANENAYSLRVDSARGDLGRAASSINELLSQIQERDIALRRRSAELEAANKDLESFAYSVSHDLRAPLGSIDGFTHAIELDYSDRFDNQGKEYLSWIRQGCTQMRDLIDGLLQMTRLSRAEVQREAVDLSSIARTVADSLKQSDPARPVRFEIREGLRAVGDERLLRAVLENLMSNAWKFTRHRDEAKIEFGIADGAYYIRDNGAGFDPSHAAKMFRPFQRLHSMREFEGTGIGLATVQKIIERHGGKTWAEGEVEKGATIYFTTA